MRHEQGASQGDGRAAKANTYIGICAGEDYQDPEEISGVDFRPSRARRSRFSGRYDFKILKREKPEISSGHKARQRRAGGRERDGSKTC